MLIHINNYYIVKSTNSPVFDASDSDIVEFLKLKSPLEDEY